MSEQPKINPCPFCGSSELEAYTDGDMWEGEMYILRCTNCTARIQGHSANITAERWNKRERPQA